MSQNRSIITLAHGNGGRFMRELIEDVFARHLANDLLDVNLDAALLASPQQELFFTTDGFTVNPLEFPGGSIGSLAIHGTVNDLAVAGARPLYLSLNAFLEEGLEFAVLERVILDMAQAVKRAGVKIVAGDTKVVPRGQGAGIYLATSGIGEKLFRHTLGLSEIRAGDVIITSGSLGDHGAAVMLAREEFGLSGDLHSDSANVFPFTRALADCTGVRFMRDPTRGGLVSVAHEISRTTGLQIRLDQPSIPIRPAVQSVCDMLGYDPYYLACEGRVIAVVAAEDAGYVLEQWRKLPDGEQAAAIGKVESGEHRVILQTEIGGERFLEELEDDPLPRIC